MARPTLSQRPAMPSRDDPYEVFTSAANAGLASLNIWDDEVSSLSAWMELTGAYIESDRAEALASRNAAVIAAESATGAETAIINAVGDGLAGVTILHSGMDTGWIYPTLVQGWQDGISYGSSPLRMRKFPTGLVKVRGLVSSATGSGTAINFPAGFRPGRSFVVIAAMRNGSAAELRIGSSSMGIALGYPPPPASDIIIDFSFYAEA